MLTVTDETHPRLPRPIIEECGNNPGVYLIDCPGCKFLHAINTLNPDRPRWTFNGNMEKPTFSPSILVTTPEGGVSERRVCHSFIVDGVWQFLSDCTHELAGQNVPMVPVDTYD